MNWSEFPQWLVTAILGAGIIKVFDVVFQRNQEKRQRRIHIAEKLIHEVNKLSHLADLYQLFARVEYKRHKDDNSIEEKLLEPEDRFIQAINEMHGVDLNQLTAQKILDLRLSSSEILDLTDFIDPSGNLSR